MAKPSEPLAWRSQVAKGDDPEGISFSGRDYWRLGEAKANSRVKSGGGEATEARKMMSAKLTRQSWPGSKIQVAKIGEINRRLITKSKIWSEASLREVED